MKRVSTPIVGGQGKLRPRIIIKIVLRSDNVKLPSKVSWLKTLVGK